MKKFAIITILVIGIIAFTSKDAKAQNHVATTNIKINLTDVISIDNERGAIGGLVKFKYATADDYESTKSSHEPTSLIVTSTKNFDIDVKANGEHFEKGGDRIPVNVLTIKPVKKGIKPVTGKHSKIVLSAANQKLISSSEIRGRLMLELDYEIPQTKSSSPDMMGKPPGTYTQTVVYTATAL